MFGVAFMERARAANRVALIVGVAKYKFVPELANTINDANKMAESLKRLNFDVTIITNPSRSEFEVALMEYGNRVNNAEASLFYYAGHALEVAGRNWLLPADAKINSARDLRFQAIDVQAVLDQTQSSRASLLFLDACRNNPFNEILSRGSRGQPSRGLAAIDPATGIYVAFSTAPGQVASDGTGANSPFTEALLKHIETPGLEIRQLMSRVRGDVRSKTGDQVPWEQSALDGDFYFSPPKPSPPIGTRTSQDMAPRSPSIDNEGLFWDSIRNSVDPEDFAAYLKQFPTGIYSGLATNRLRALQSRVTEDKDKGIPVRTEDLRKAEAERLEAQRKAAEAAVKAEAERKAAEAARLEAQRKAAEAERLEAQRKAAEAAVKAEAERKAFETPNAEAKNGIPTDEANQVMTTTIPLNEEQLIGNSVKSTTSSSVQSDADQKRTQKAKTDEIRRAKDKAAAAALEQKKIREKEAREKATRDARNGVPPKAENTASKQTNPPIVGPTPSYLSNKPDWCAAAIAQTAAQGTTRGYIPPPCL
jgi:hypothetical protein